MRVGGRGQQRSQQTPALRGPSIKRHHSCRGGPPGTSRGVLFRSRESATSILMKYINAYIPHAPTSFLLLILFDAWTHEGRKSGEAHLKEKQESPWGSRTQKRKERNGKERGVGVWGWWREWWVFRKEVDLDSEQDTRAVGMNINSAVSWKIVTLDIIDRCRLAMRSRLHSWP